MHQKDTRRKYSVSLVYVCPILLVGMFSYSLGDHVFLKLQLSDIAVCKSLYLQSERPGTGLSKPKSHQSAGESAGKSAGKRGLLGALLDGRFRTMSNATLADATSVFQIFVLFYF